MELKEQRKPTKFRRKFGHHAKLGRTYSGLNMGIVGSQKKGKVVPFDGSASGFGTSFTEDELDAPISKTKSEVLRVEDFDEEFVDDTMHSGNTSDGGDYYSEDYTNILKTIRHQIDRLEKVRNNLDEGDPRKKESIIPYLQVSKSHSSSSSLPDSSSSKQNSPSGPFGHFSPGFMQFTGAASNPYQAVFGASGQFVTNGEDKDDSSVRSEGSNRAYIPIPVPVFIPPSMMVPMTNFAHTQNPYLSPTAGYPGLSGPNVLMASPEEQMKHHVATSLLTPVTNFTSTPRSNGNHPEADSGPRTSPAYMSPSRSGEKISKGNKSALVSI